MSDSNDEASIRKGDEIKVALSTVAQAAAGASAISATTPIGIVAATVGGIVGTGMSYFLTNRTTERISRTIQEINDELARFKNDADLTDEILEQIFHILRESGLTANEEKRKSLKNAAVKSIISDSDEITRHRLNRSAIDLIPAHVRVLMNVYEQTRMTPYSNKRIEPPNRYELHSIIEVNPVSPYVKAGISSEELYNGLLFDLERLGMLKDKDAGTIDAVGREIKDPHITEFGIKFLDWISDLPDPSE